AFARALQDVVPHADEAARHGAPPAWLSEGVAERAARSLKVIYTRVRPSSTMYQGIKSRRASGPSGVCRDTIALVLAKVPAYCTAGSAIQSAVRKSSNPFSFQLTNSSLGVSVSNHDISTCRAKAARTAVSGTSIPCST